MPYPYHNGMLGQQLMVSAQLLLARVRFAQSTECRPVGEGGARREIDVSPLARRRAPKNKTRGPVCIHTDIERSARFRGDGFGASLCSRVSAFFSCLSGGGTRFPHLPWSNITVYSRPVEWAERPDPRLLDQTAGEKEINIRERGTGETGETEAKEKKEKKSGPRFSAGGQG